MILSAGCLVTLAVAAALPAVESGELLLASARPGPRPPAAVLRAYAAFLRDSRRPDGMRLLRERVLADAVRVVADPRPRLPWEGDDVNIPFLRSGFVAGIVFVRKLSDQAYLLRTGSSSIYFVDVSGQGWKVYKYTDFPVR